MSPRPKLRTRPAAGVVVAIVYQPSSWAIPKGPWSSRSADGGGSPRAASRAPSRERPAPAVTKPRRLITDGLLEGRPQAQTYLSSGCEPFDAPDGPRTEDAGGAVVRVAVEQEAVELREPAAVPH